MLLSGPGLHCSGAKKEPQSQKLARTAPKNFLNNSRGLPVITIKTRVSRQITPESSPESSAKSLSQKFFGVPFLSLNYTNCLWYYTPASQKRLYIHHRGARKGGGEGGFKGGGGLSGEGGLGSDGARRVSAGNLGGGAKYFFRGRNAHQVKYLLELLSRKLHYTYSFVTQRIAWSNVWGIRFSEFQLHKKSLRSGFGINFAIISDCSSWFQINYISITLHEWCSNQFCNHVGMHGSVLPKGSKAAAAAAVCKCTEDSQNWLLIAGDGPGTSHGPTILLWTCSRRTPSGHLLRVALCRTKLSRRLLNRQGRKHPSRDVIFSGQNSAKKCQKVSLYMTSSNFKTSTFGITWCGSF